mgnify:CR=1 FL=1
MTYFWSVLPGPPHTDALKLFLANIPGPLMVMPSSYVKEALVEGEDYIFSLTVENHFGNRSAVAFFGVNSLSLSLSLSLTHTHTHTHIIFTYLFFTQQVRIDYYPIPTVTLNPSYLSNLVSTRVPIHTKLSGQAVVSGCATPYLNPRDQIEYSWIKADGDSVVQVDLATTNTPQLSIPANSFQAGKRYTMELRARHLSYPLFTGSSQAIIDVLLTPPYASIEGGAYISYFIYFFFLQALIFSFFVLFASLQVRPGCCRLQLHQASICCCLRIHWISTGQARASPTYGLATN